MGCRSERGVVFFRDAEITPDQQKTLVSSLGRHGGKPSTSTLHVHPLTCSTTEFGDEISVISSEFHFDKNFSRDDYALLNRPVGKTIWVSQHSAYWRGVRELS